MQSATCIIELWAQNYSVMAACETQNIVSWYNTSGHVVGKQPISAFETPCMSEWSYRPTTFSYRLYDTTYSVIPTVVVDSWIVNQFSCTTTGRKVWEVRNRFLAVRYWSSLRHICCVGCAITAMEKIIISDVVFTVDEVAETCMPYGNMCRYFLL